MFGECTPLDVNSIMALQQSILRCSIRMTVLLWNDGDMNMNNYNRCQTTLNITAE